jgi:hypothetical protein
MKKKWIAISAIAIVFVLAVILVVLPSKDKPPVKSDPINLPELQTSRIAMPISISTFDLQRAIREQISSPAVSGVTPEIDAKLFAAESITTDQLVKELVTPFIPGHYIDVAHTEYRAVTESFSCLLNPLHWGTCWRTVMKPFTIIVKEWVAPQEAVYRYVSKPVTSLLDKLYDVGAWVHYNIYVDDLKISFSGNNVLLNVSTTTHLVFDYKQPVLPGNVSFTIKGILSCDLKNDIQVSATINLDQDMKLNIDVKDDNTSLDFTKACAPLAVQGINLMSYINPYFLATKKGLGIAVQKAFLNALNKKIGDYNSELSFKTRIENALQSIADVKKIDNNIWMVPNVQGGLISNFDTYDQDGISWLRLNVGIDAKPSFVYSVDTPLVENKQFYIKKEDFNPIVNSRLKMAIKYSSASKTLTDSIKSFVSKYASKYHLSADTVTLYPSKDKLVVAIDFLKGSSNKKSAVYLWGIPKFHQGTNSFWVDSLDYYIKSKNVIIKLADKIFSAEILKCLKKNSRWSVDNQLKDILERFRAFQYSNEMGTLKGSLKQLNLSKTFIDKDAMTAYVDLSGNLSFTIQPMKFIAPTALNAIDTSLKNADTGFTTVPIYKPGDTLITMVNDSLLKKIVTFKESQLPGDSVFYTDKTGTIRYYILSNADVLQKVIKIKE